MAVQEESRAVDRYRAGPRLGVDDGDASRADSQEVDVASIGRRPVIKRVPVFRGQRRKRFSECLLPVAPAAKFAERREAHSDFSPQNLGYLGESSGLLAGGITGSHNSWIIDAGMSTSTGSTSARDETQHEEVEQLIVCPGSPRGRGQDGSHKLSTG